MISSLACGIAGAEGRAVLEFPYAVDMIEQGEFDTIYHEHVFYFTITALEPLFARHGLRITWRSAPRCMGDRCGFVRHATYAADNSVTELRAAEALAGVNTAAYYENFAAQAAATRDALRSKLAALQAADQRVAAYGAAAKGSTLMNYCGLTPTDLEFVADRSPHKHGRLTPGTHVPVVDADEVAKRAPDVTLLLAWNFADEILAQQRLSGSRRSVPDPDPRSAPDLMQFTETHLPGVYVIDLDRHEDDLGWLRVRGAARLLPRRDCRWIWPSAISRTTPAAALCGACISGCPTRRGQDGAMRVRAVHDVALDLAGVADLQAILRDGTQCNQRLRLYA